ncbi:MAG: hypothetical protein ACRC26_07530, partial [Bacteroidales bacterium]
NNSHHHEGNRYFIIFHNSCFLRGLPSTRRVVPVSDNDSRLLFNFTVSGCKDTTKDKYIQRISDN